VLVFDGYVASDRQRGASGGAPNTTGQRIGARVELVTKF
jgi:hypothetical protein